MQDHKRAIRVFKLFTFWFWFSNYVLNPYMSPYAQSLGATNVVIGFIVSAYSVAQIILKIPIGIASDRLNKKKLFIVIGAAITFISELGMYISGTVNGLIAFRLLQGIAVASWVCATVLFASYLPADQAVNATVQLQICNSAGTLTGYFVGSFITSRFGYRSVFLLATFGAAIAFIITLFMREEESAAKKPITAAEVLRVGRSPFLLFVTSVCLVGQMILATSTWGFTPTLAVALNANASQVSMISVCSSVPGLICSMFVSRRLVARWGEKKVIILATAMEALFCLLQPFSTNLFWLGVTCVFTGFFHAMSYSVLLGLSIKHFPNRMRAAAMGFMQSFYCIGLFIGPVISGYFSDLYGLKAGFIVIGALGFIAPVVTALLFERTEKKTLQEIQEGRL